ncbi:unnamed protein product [Closterium sp. NIES-64]|nr:unnamed protein product [Closterium sp. NIES-64]
MALHSVSAACITSAASPSPSLHSSSSLHCSSSDVTASVAFLGQPWTSRPDRVSALCAFRKNLSRPRNEGSSRDDLSSRAALSKFSSRHPSTALLPCAGGGLPVPQVLLSTRASAAADAASAATLPEQQQQQQPWSRQNQQTRGGESGAEQYRRSAGQSRNDGDSGGGGGGVGGAPSRFNSRGRRGGESGANSGSFARGRGGGYSNGNGNDSPLATLTRVSSCLAALREAKQQWMEERRRRASQAKKKKAKISRKSKEGVADQGTQAASVDEPVAAAAAVAVADATDAAASAAASPAGSPAADGATDAASTPPETLESVVWPILDQSEREWVQSDVILVLKELGAQRGEHDLLGAVFAWLQHVEGTSKELEAGVRACTTVLAAYGKAGNVEQMEAVARGMEARGVFPDLFTYNALIGGYARAGRWRAAIGVYERVREDEMVEPDRVTCVEMAMMLAAAKQPIPLRAVLDDMLALRIPVDAKLLERAVPVLARGGEHAVITALHRSLCQEGVKLPASLAVACINAYSALGMPQHAEGVFQALQQQQGRVEDRRVYVGLLRAYASNGQMREAEGVVQDMLQGGVRPSTGCFLALLDGYTRLGEFGLAEGVLEYMRELQLTPDPSLHLALISAYLSASHPAWAHSALCDLLAEHPAFQPPVEVIEGIMAGYLGGEGEGGVAEGGEAEGKGEGVGLDGSNAAPAAAAGSADSAAAGAADPPAAGSAAAAAAAEAVLQVAVKRGVEPSNACRQLLLRARLVQAEEGERGTGKEREEGGEGGEGGVEKGEGKEGAVSVVEAAENAAGGKVAEESIKTVENGKAAAPVTQVESAAVAGAEESTVAGAKSTVAAEESAVAVAGAAVVEVEKELDAPVITGAGEATVTASHATAAEVTGKAAAVKVAETAAAVKVAETAAAVKVTETAAAVKVTEKAAAVKVSEKATAVKVTGKAAAVKVTEKAAVKVTEKAAVKVTEKAAAVKVTEKAVAVKVTEKAADVKVTEKATAPEKMAKRAELTEKATAAEVGGVLSSTEATEQTREESLLLMLQKGFTVGEKQVVAELEAAGLVGGEESEKGAVGGVAVGGGGPAAVMTLWKVRIFVLSRSPPHSYSLCFLFPFPSLPRSLSPSSISPPLTLHSGFLSIRFSLSPIIKHVQSLRSIPNFQPTVAMFVPVIKNRALAGDFPSLCSIMADLRGLGLIPSDQVFAALRLAPLESAGAKTSAAVTSTAVAEASKEVVLEGGSGKGEGGDGGGVKQRVSGKGKYRRKASEKKDERDEEKDVRGEKSKGKPVVVKREVEAGGEVEAVEQKGRGEVLEPMKVVAEEGNKQAEIEMVVSVGKFSVEREDETGMEKKRLDTSIDQKDRKRTEKTVQAQRLDVGAVEKYGGPGKAEVRERLGGQKDEVASKGMKTEPDAGDAVTTPTTQETPSHEGRKEAIVTTAPTEGKVVRKPEPNQQGLEVSENPSADIVVGDATASSASGSGGETMQKQEEMMANVVEKAGREKNGRKRELEKVGLGKGALANVKGFGPWSKATKKAGKGFGKTGGKGVRKEQKLKEDMNVEIAREAAHVETVVETVA